MYSKKSINVFKKSINKFKYVVLTLHLEFVRRGDRIAPHFRVGGRAAHYSSVVVRSDQNAGSGHRRVLVQSRLRIIQFQCIKLIN